MPKSIHSPEQVRLQEMLLRVRKEAGLRQEEVASKLGRPQSFVSKFETGERRLDLVELRSVCQALGIGLEAFVRKFEKSLKSPPKPN